MTESLGLNVETFDFDNLFAGDKPKITQTATLLTGNNLKRGALLGKITASSKYVVAISGAGNGSEVPRAILARDTDASAADVVTTIYEEGDFNITQVTNNSTGSDLFPLSDVNLLELRRKGLQFHSTVPK